VVLAADPFWTPPAEFAGADLAILRGNPRLPGVIEALDLTDVECVYLALEDRGLAGQIALQISGRDPEVGVFTVAETSTGLKVVEADRAISLERRRCQAARMLEGIDAGDRVLVLTHNDPDPDALSSAAGLSKFFEHHGVEARIGHGGSISRPENRKMVEVLELQLEHASEIDWQRYHHVAMVDGQPGANCALPPGCSADIVLDHHLAGSDLQGCRFIDIDQSYGSTATLVFDYLRAIGVEIDARVATALFYGIKTDTRMRGRDVKQVDLEALLALRGKIDADALAEIEQVEYTPEIFRSLSDAARNAEICNGVLVSYLGKVSDRDTVAQAADFCTRVEGVRWVLVAGIRGEDLIFSVRSLEHRDHAGAATRRAFADLGSCGGRRPMAGGQFPMRLLVPEGRLIRSRVREALLARFVPAALASAEAG